jgi:hypothetical protein
VRWNREGHGAETVVSVGAVFEDEDLEGADVQRFLSAVVGGQEN